MKKQLLIRVVVTALVAWPIAVIVSMDTLSRVWIGIVCWVVLYWLWKWGARHGNSITRPPWRRAVRRIITLVTGAVALVFFMTVVMMILDLRHSESQVKAERNKVQIGMTIGDVLPLVHGDMGIRAHAVLPDNVADEEFVHSANLMQQRDGTFVCSCGTKKELWRLQNLTESEAAELMKQKMSDGYEWRWRYTFVTATPLHFSFTVTFGRDGRVKDITDVWGWD
jgi:heme/copper-type cytochrome/quinol oxidase subunit 2